MTSGLRGLTGSLANPRRPVADLCWGDSLAVLGWTVIRRRFSDTRNGSVVSLSLGHALTCLVADMWDAKEQQFAVAFVVFSSVFGSVIGPLVGPFIQAHLSWQWICWTQLAFGAFAQALHLFFVPETRSAILLDREAKRRREAGETHIYGPSELKEDRFSRKEIIKTWTRPFIMFATEPIVLFCSLLSGFSDALIFTFLEAFTPVYKQWNFTTEQMALTFLPLAIGYFLAWFSYFPPLAAQRKALKKNPNAAPEMRLWWLLYRASSRGVRKAVTDPSVAPLETIGLFGFAWTSLGPPQTHWIAPMIFSGMVGIANYAIYMSTIDYMIAAYGPYAASATGGNGLARDFLAGIAAMYSAPFYNNVGGPRYRYHLEWPTTILAIIAFFVTIPVYVFYFKGQWFRERSAFAQSLAGDRDERELKRQETMRSQAEQ